MPVRDWVRVRLSDLSQSAGFSLLLISRRVGSRNNIDELRCDLKHVTLTLLVWKDACLYSILYSYSSLGFSIKFTVNILNKKIAKVVRVVNNPERGESLQDFFWIQMRYNLIHMAPKEWEIHVHPIWRRSVLQQCTMTSADIIRSKCVRHTSDVTGYLLCFVFLPAYSDWYRFF